MHDLFVYGSLMCQDIMQAVAGPCCRKAEAVLHNYRRQAVRHEHYPGIIQAAGFSVQGIVYTGVNNTGLLKLDEFEGDMYQRTEVVAELADGLVMSVHTYVIKPAFMDQLEQRDWSYDDFLRQGKDEFVSRYLGFQRIAEPELGQ